MFMRFLFIIMMVCSGWLYASPEKIYFSPSGIINGSPMIFELYGKAYNIADSDKSALDEKLNGIFEDGDLSPESLIIKRFLLAQDGKYDDIRSLYSADYDDEQLENLLSSIKSQSEYIDKLQGILFKTKLYFGNKLRIKYKVVSGEKFVPAWVAIFKVDGGKFYFLDECADKLVNQIGESFQYWENDTWSLSQKVDSYQKILVIEDDHFPVTLNLKLNKHTLSADDALVGFIQEMRERLDDPDAFLLSWTGLDQRSRLNTKENVYPVVKRYFDSHFDPNDIFFSLMFGSETYLFFQDSDRDMPFFTLCLKKDDEGYHLIGRPESFFVTQVVMNPILINKITEAFSTESSEGKCFGKEK
jgi:hypothetical protein